MHSSFIKDPIYILVKYWVRRMKALVKEKVFFRGTNTVALLQLISGLLDLKPFSADIGILTKLSI